MRKSTAPGAHTLVSKSRWAAATPRSDAHSCAAETRLLRIPVFSKIFSAVQSPSSPARSSFVDRKSTRLNSSHSQISYAVFCLKKKKNELYESVTTYRLAID